MPEDGCRDARPEPLLESGVRPPSPARTHLALEKDAPISRPVRTASAGRIVVTPHVGGLQHRYDRAAA